MPTEILMPELGEGVHEGTVSRWLKNVGDFVKEDEPVVEIMTDKVNTELGAPASGYLTQILIQEGEPVEVFAAMGMIGTEEEAKSGAAAPAPATPSEPKTVPAAEEPIASTIEIADSMFSNVAHQNVVEPEGRVWFTPVVRAIQKEHGLTDGQLLSIQGTGADGRVTKKDVEAFLGGAKPASKPTAAAPEVKAAPPIVAGPDQTTEKLAGMRKMIAEAMVRSHAIPTVSTMAEVDVTKLVAFRAENKESFPAQFGVKLTYTPFFIKALAEGLMEFPLVNASLQPDYTLIKNKNVHMGVAVSLGKNGDEGLIVPVIRDCNTKSLIDIAKDLEEIAAKARSNQLGVADVQGGTFTLTNPGSYGAVLGTPMINAPQAAILGTYTIKQVPVIIDGMIAIRSVMNLVLTYDHRIIDGSVAGKFLLSVKKKLENFEFFK
ncbi:MAG: 2-oxo acid dehydrogenase subunit E2 [Chthonomonas sp.]|nr:2-oxo acid dehydrogenase subunit E2 [Chthonomonas sp.]